MNNGKLRVLVVDDTVVYRKIVSDILAEMPNVEVVGTANNGKIAMSRIDMAKPDLLILDVEMPEADGLEVLAYIKQKRLDVSAIMLSSYTQKGSERTIQALELGGLRFYPQTGNLVYRSKSYRGQTGLVSCRRGLCSSGGN